MKRLRLIIVSMSLFQLVSAKLYAQTVSDFENLTLPADSFFNGSSQQGGTNFISGNATFPNFFDPSFQYWLSGGHTAMLLIAALQALEICMPALH